MCRQPTCIELFPKMLAKVHARVHVVARGGLLEYTVRFRNNRRLQSGKNVHVSIEVGVFLWKNVLRM